jgi:hypothetical protein
MYNIGCKGQVSGVLVGVGIGAIQGGRRGEGGCVRGESEGVR